MSDDRIVKIERRIAASPEDVFDAWITPAVLAKWWGPEGVTLGDCDLDVREGGKWRTVMCLSDGSEHVVTGVYRTIERPNRLVMSFAWEEDGVPGHETEVALTFAPAGDGTLLTLVHAGFETAERRDQHDGGWSSSLNDLERVFA